MLVFEAPVASPCRRYRNEQVRESKSPGARGQRRCPVGKEGEVRLRVGGNDAVQHLGHDASADASESVAGLTDGRLFEDVEPERRLALPAVVSQIELALGQDVDAEQMRDGLTGGESGALPPLEVACGQGAVGLVVDCAGDRFGSSISERGSSASIGLERCAAGRPGTSKRSDQSTRRSSIGPKPISSGKTG
jgi:hypothetical protein